MKNKVLVFIALVPMIIVILFGCVDEYKYSWSSDYSTCTKYKKYENKKEGTVVQTEKIEIKATCTEKGEIRYKADFGGKDIQTAGPFEVDPLGHNFGDWVDGKRQCNRCGEIETCNHDGSRKNIEIEATRTTDGYKRQVCEICGKVLIQETIKAKGDIPGNAKFTNGIFRKINNETVNDNETNESVDEETVNTTSEITKEATCIESGKRTYTAKFSDGTTKTKDVTIPVKNHDYGEWKDTKDGLCARKCQNCSAVETKIHEYGDWINGVRTCKNCGAKESCIHEGTTKEISMSYPTCTEDGVKKLECSRCKKTWTEKISAMGHNYGEWKDTKNGSCARKCQNCFAIETKIHDYGDWINGVRTCKNCGAKEECDHSGDDNIEVKWESDGDKCVNLGICTNCNKEIFREEGPHDWKTIFETDTVEQKRCNRCGKEIVVSKSS